MDTLIPDIKTSNMQDGHGAATNRPGNIQRTASQKIRDNTKADELRKNLKRSLQFRIYQEKANLVKGVFKDNPLIDFLK